MHFRLTGNHTCPLILVKCPCKAAYACWLLKIHLAKPLQINTNLPQHSYGKLWQLWLTYNFTAEVVLILSNMKGCRSLKSSITLFAISCISCYQIFQLCKFFSSISEKKKIPEICKGVRKLLLLKIREPFFVLHSLHVLEKTAFWPERSPAINTSEVCFLVCGNKLVLSF